MDTKDINSINSDGEEIDERVGFLKENFTLLDFLKDENTYDILESNYIWKVDNDLYGPIEDFYKDAVDYNKSNHSLLFSNEHNYKSLGELQGVVYRSLEKQYNLNIFYDHPDYAESMVENYNNRIKNEKREERMKIKEEYNKQSNANMKFDWSTRKFNI
jgi:hypothetical protein